MCQARELGVDFVGHGKPVKAMVQGSPGPERANTPRVCSVEAEFSAEMLAGAPPWDVLQPYHQPSALYQPCDHRKGPSHLRISSSAKQIERRPEDLSRSSFQPVIVTQATPAATSAAHFQAGTWRMATSLPTL